MVGGFTTNNYWSSTENNSTNAWNQNFNNGNQNNNNKTNTNYVRSIRGFKQNIQYPKLKYSGIFYLHWVMQLNLFNTQNKNSTQIELWELFNAYYSCRSNKRNTYNALAFEVDYESNLVQLCKDLNNNNYKIGRSLAFIIKKPVIREIFAADFRDRVVHHLIINKLNPLFEKEFIKDSAACRIGKGTHFGIKRVEGFIQKCSFNYTQDCYILKLDILAFFMHINRSFLFERLQHFINDKYHESDKDLLIHICKQIIFNEPTQNCTIKGNIKNWEGLPNNKSLFHSAPGCGLPIGNLTSQVFANFYMNSFDHFIKHELNIKYYLRYVDDFVIIHPDKTYLKSVTILISDFLNSSLKLQLHPKKKYLQHYSKGVCFLDTVIKPYRTYIANRCKGNFYLAIQKQNSIIKNNATSNAQLQSFLSTMNSYFGIMKHYKTYHLRMGMIIKHLNVCWWRLVNLNAYKFTLRKNRALENNMLLKFMEAKQ